MQLNQEQALSLAKNTEEPFWTMPSGLSREEKRQFIIACASAWIDAERKAEEE